MTTVSLGQLNRRFYEKPWYQPERGYRLLPMRFTQLDDARWVATNLAGEIIVLQRAQLVALIDGCLPASDPVYRELVSRHFVLQDNGLSALDLLATKYRTKHSQLPDFTALHMFVVTLRCDHSCPYCQVSRVSTDKSAFDMTVETADRAVDLLFQSPNPVLKVEFQGGESLLNFDLIKHIVLAVKERNRSEQRNVQFVVATNLSPLNDDVLAFCHDHGLFISTSLDGPRELHNANRPRPGGDSYERTLSGIERCRSVLGPDSVSALMTTTSRSLTMPEAIVDEYVARGFRSVFLRWLSPYGFAAKTGALLGYPVQAWNEFYERGLRHVLRLSREGHDIRETYATIVLRKMLTPFPSGYVDLQSPTGLGISAVVYNYDGEVYASDESRMIAELGDTTFRLGNVHRNSYAEIFQSERLVDLVASTMTERTPACTDCAFEPFCGTDPVFHHATQGDHIGHRPTSAFCSRNMFIFRLLVRMLEDEPECASILRRWAL